MGRVKGNVSFGGAFRFAKYGLKLYVGPTKISLSNTERLVEFRDGRFVPVRGEEGSFGVYPFIIASSAQYVILENPPKDQNSKPVKGNNSSIELLTGKKVVVPGPVTFPLWPGQKAKVINRHKLREDQYLVMRVYDKVEGDDSPIGTNAEGLAEAVRGLGRVAERK